MPPYDSLSRSRSHPDLSLAPPLEVARRDGRLGADSGRTRKLAPRHGGSGDSSVGKAAFLSCPISADGRRWRRKRRCKDGGGAPAAPGWRGDGTGRGRTGAGQTRPPPGIRLSGRMSLLVRWIHFLGGPRQSAGQEEAACTPDGTPPTKWGHLGGISRPVLVYQRRDKSVCVEEPNSFERRLLTNAETL